MNLWFSDQKGIVDQKKLDNKADYTFENNLDKLFLKSPRKH